MLLLEAYIKEKNQTRTSAFQEMDKIATPATKRKNPFMQPYNTPHGTTPFDLIQMSDYEPAFMQGIEEEDSEIADIANNIEPPTFANTIERFNQPGGLLDRVSGVFFNLLSAETNDEIDALTQKLSPILSKHANDMRLNSQLFERIKAVHRHHRRLTDEEKMLLDNCYDGFVRSGALLDKAGKEKLRH